MTQDAPKQVLIAKRGSAKLTVTEQRLTKSVENIAVILFENKELFESKDLYRVLSRFENTLHAMAEMFQNAAYLVDPVTLLALKDDIESFKAEIEAQI